MSSSVTVDWRAIRERERQACLALRAELAQLREWEKQLRLRHATVSAAHGRLAAEVYRVGRLGGSADSAELGHLVTEARAGLAGSETMLDQAISRISREKARRAAAAPEWTARSESAMAPLPGVRPGAGFDELVPETREDSGQGAASEQVTDALLATEADAVIEECRLRCPRADVAELTGLRAKLGASPLGDRMVIHDIRACAARIIRQAKREEELQAQRQRLFVLAEEAPAAERAALRRRVADAPPGDLPRLEPEVAAAVQRASAARARAEAMEALEQSLTELGYDLQGGFESLWPSPGGQPGHQGGEAAPRFLVAASPHSADHGLRVRVGEDQLYLSVVRRAGTAMSAAFLQADTAVQERTCRDLESVAEAAAGQGVQIILGNAQAPGRPAPELASEYWPAAASAGDSAEENGGRQRRRQWTEHEHQRAAGHQQSRRPRP